MRISDWSSDVCSSDLSFRYQKVLVPLATHGYRPLTGKARLVGSTARRFRGGPMASVVNSPEDMDSLEKEDLSLPDDYRPSPDEEFMNERQLEYFRQLLLNWKKKILSEAEGTLAVLQKEPLREPDLNDRASSETDWSIELRTSDQIGRA